MAKNAVVGAHLFYRWAGGWGRASAFSQHYARREPSAGALRSAALAALASRPAQAQPTEVADIPGAEVEQASAGRVAVRFHLAEARKAVEEAPHEAYVEKVAASDNLRWTLTGSKPDSGSQAPLGRSAPPQAATTAAN
jgi:hypothetical protein